MGKNQIRGSTLGSGNSGGRRGLKKNRLRNRQNSEEIFWGPKENRLQEWDLRGGRKPGKEVWGGSSRRESLTDDWSRRCYAGIDVVPGIFERELELGQQKKHQHRSIPS